jgi:hypothetical protein
MQAHRLWRSAAASVVLAIFAVFGPQVVGTASLRNNLDLSVPFAALLTWALSLPWTVSSPRRTWLEGTAPRKLTGIRVLHVVASGLFTSLLLLIVLAASGKDPIPWVRDVGLYMSLGYILKAVGAEDIVAICGTFAYMGLSLLVGFDRNGRAGVWAAPIQTDGSRSSWLITAAAASVAVALEVRNRRIDGGSAD